MWRFWLTDFLNEYLLESSSGGRKVRAERPDASTHLEFGGKFAATAAVLAGRVWIGEVELDSRLHLVRPAWKSSLER
jgi:hypothetical protein